MARTMADVDSVIDRLAEMENSRVKSEAKTNSLLETMPTRLADALADRLGPLTSRDGNSESYARKSELSVYIVIVIATLGFMVAGLGWTMSTMIHQHRQVTNRLIYDGFYQTATCKQLRATALALGDQSINLPECMTPEDAPRLD